MTVAELIEILKQYPQHLRVGYFLYSEQCLLEESDIRIKEACIARADGWIQDKRLDMPTEEYLMFPGN